MKFAEYFVKQHWKTVAKFLLFIVVVYGVTAGLMLWINSFGPNAAHIVGYVLDGIIVLGGLSAVGFIIWDVIKEDKEKFDDQKIL